MWAAILSSNPCPMLRYIHNNQWMQGNCDRWNGSRTGHNTVSIVYSWICALFAGAGCWRCTRCWIRRGRCCVCGRITSWCFANIIVTIDVHIFICCCYRHIFFLNKHDLRLYLFYFGIIHKWKIIIIKRWKIFYGDLTKMNFQWIMNVDLSWFESALILLLQYKNSVYRLTVHLFVRHNENHCQKLQPKTIQSVKVSVYIRHGSHEYLSNFARRPTIFVIFIIRKCVRCMLRSISYFIHIELMFFVHVIVFNVKIEQKNYFL